ncbi:AraC family transcriptional regulator [Stigmatella sp. ncwal1]|uniref:AraC family transcriptional regulator n=1 Tax=Stigmatella ashevillensis TaxID=2995309 RepID=A0ABT5DG59_9BACT|nr:AraC family transcriptional regulator [Stigmatella ashevillena]MDC0712564.1 AraC family transcriptional regulator [Stigmatella ashevillena]
MLWCPEELGGLELLKATYITHAFAPHSHEGFAIGVIERGVEAFRHRGQMQYAPAGRVVLVNPGEVHTGHGPEEGGWTYRMLYPEPRLLEEAAIELTGDSWGVPFFPVPVVDDPEAAALIRALHASLEQPTSALERQSRLLSALVLLVARHAAPHPGMRPMGTEHEAVRRARDFLEAHPGENITLEQLSRHAGLSVFHLVRVFRRKLGLPPHAYQIELRVRRARELLRQGLPPGHVAATLGFSDQSHLTREFKRRVGLTPSRYAASTRSFKTGRLSAP